MNPQPLKYHGPGWSITLPDGTTFMLWAPGGERRRPDWRASWDDPVTEGGNFASGDTINDAMTAFDTYGLGPITGTSPTVEAVKRAFRHVAVTHLLSEVAGEPLNIEHRESER